MNWWIEGHFGSEWEGREAPAALVSKYMMFWEVRFSGGRNPSKIIVNDTFASGSTFLMMSFSQIANLALGWLAVVVKNIFLWEARVSPLTSLHHLCFQVCARVAEDLLVVLKPPPT